MEVCRKGVLGGEFGENGGVDGIERGGFGEKEEWFWEVVGDVIAPVANQGGSGRKWVRLGYF